MKCFKTHTHTHWELFWQKLLKNVYDGEEAGFLCRTVYLWSPVKYYVSFHVKRRDLNTWNKQEASALGLHYSPLLYQHQLGNRKALFYYSLPPATIHLWHSSIKTVISLFLFSFFCCIKRASSWLLQKVCGNMGAGTLQVRSLSQSHQACDASLSMILL